MGIDLQIVTRFSKPTKYNIPVGKVWKAHNTKIVTTIFIFKKVQIMVQVTIFSLINFM